MKKIRFLHCADIHLDAPFKSLVTKENTPNKKRNDLIEVLENIFKKAFEYEVDFIIISGDLFEEDYIRRSTILKLKDIFRSFEKLIFIAPGNHDPILFKSTYRNENWSDNVKIFDHNFTMYEIEDLEVRVYGVGFKDCFERKSILYNIDREKIDHNYINILAIHGTLDLNISNRTQNPLETDEIELYGMDYVGLGHMHNKIERKGRREEIFNPGSPEPLKLDEEGIHGVFIGEICKYENGSKILKTEFIKTQKNICKKVVVNIYSESDDEAFKSILEQIYLNIKDIESSFKRENIILSIEITGFVLDNYILNEEYIFEKLCSEFYFIKIVNKTKKLIVGEDYSNDKTLKGLYIKRILELINSTNDEEKIKRYNLALYYGLQAIEEGKVSIGGD